MTLPVLWKQLEKSLNIIEGLRGEPDTVGRPAISERALRSITMFDDEHQQLQAFADILSK